MATISSGGTATKFRFIKQYRFRFGITRLCSRLNVSRSGYYAWLRRKPSARDQQDLWLKKRITTLFQQSREVYGSPRIHKALLKQGISVGKKRVERLMREEGLKGRVARVYRRVPGLHRFFQSIKNRRRELPKPSRPNQHWAADVTYIRVKKKWMYLSAVLDLYSRRIVGWSLGSRRTVDLTKASLMMAIRNRRPEKGLLFHTDRGIEYRANEIQAVHQRYGIIPSMNRPGQCTDNAEMESFFHSLKGELIKNKYFSSEYHLRDSVAGYIQHFYNRTRLHSSLNYQSPVEYETASLL